MGSDGEKARDTLQVVTESAADHIGKIAEIVVAAARDIARELGSWVNDVVEMREATRRPTEDSQDSV